MASGGTLYSTQGSGGHLLTLTSIMVWDIGDTKKDMSLYTHHICRTYVTCFSTKYKVSPILSRSQVVLWVLLYVKFWNLINKDLKDGHKDKTFNLVK